MTRSRRFQASVLGVLSVACVLAGIALVFLPGLWTVTTGLVAGNAQINALAAWDQDTGSERTSPADALVISIPRLGVRRYVPDGATPDHLRRYGVGRISWTGWPDSPGLVGIAGHRTTYGAPFFWINRLQPGDSIELDYHGRRYAYHVVRQETVTPDQADVLNPEPLQHEVALVSCTPWYSAAFRLVVFADLADVTALASAHAGR